MFLLLVWSGGCNWAFGIDNTDIQPYFDAAPPPDGDPRIDLDRDGIKDVEDPCIAAFADALVDTDFDGLPNGVDPCPFDSEPTEDADGDGIGDLCDPSSLPGDRVRCLMAFTDAELNLAMWRIRDNADSWIFHHPRILRAVESGSIVADWSFESPRVTTFHVVGLLYATSLRFSVLARGARAPGDGDVGCTLSAGINWLLAGPGGATASLGARPSGFSTRFSLWVTLLPGGADGMTLRCAAQLGTNPMASIDATAALPFGTLGFVAEPTGTVTGLAVYERDDAP
jgi:hypothetical protein